MKYIKSIIFCFFLTLILSVPQTFAQTPSPSATPIATPPPTPEPTPVETKKTESENQAISSICKKHGFCDESETKIISGIFCIQDGKIQTKEGATNNIFEKDEDLPSNLVGKLLNCDGSPNDYDSGDEDKDEDEKGIVNPKEEEPTPKPEVDPEQALQEFCAKYPQECLENLPQEQAPVEEVSEAESGKEGGSEGGGGSSGGGGDKGSKDKSRDKDDDDEFGDKLADLATLGLLGGLNPLGGNQPYGHQQFPPHGSQQYGGGQVPPGQYGQQPGQAGPTLTKTANGGSTANTLCNPDVTSNPAINGEEVPSEEIAIRTFSHETGQNAGTRVGTMDHPDKEKEGSNIYVFHQAYDYGVPIYKPLADALRGKGEIKVYTLEGAETDLKLDFKPTKIIFYSAGCPGSYLQGAMDNTGQIPYTFLIDRNGKIYKPKPTIANKEAEPKETEGQTTEKEPEAETEQTAPPRNQLVEGAINIGLLDSYNVSLEKNAKAPNAPDIVGSSTKTLTSAQLLSHFLKYENQGIQTIEGAGEINARSANPPYHPGEGVTEALLGRAIININFDEHAELLETFPADGSFQPKQEVAPPTEDKNDDIDLDQMNPNSAGTGDIFDGLDVNGIIG